MPGVFFKDYLILISRLFPAQVMQPEIVVGFEKMFPLVAAIAVHTVWVDHEFELLPVLLQLIDKLHGTLEMDIIVTSAVSKLEHNRFIPVKSRLVLRRIADYARITISFRVCLRSLHEALGIMAVIENPVIYSTACDTIMIVV